MRGRTRQRSGFALTPSDSLGLGIQMLGLTLLLVAALRFRTVQISPTDLSVYAPAVDAWILVAASLALAASGLVRKPSVLALGHAGLGLLLLYLAPYVMGVVQVNSSDPITHTGSLIDLVERGTLIDITYAAPYTVLATLVHLTGIEPATAVAVAPAVTKALGIAYLAYLASKLEILRGARAGLAAAAGIPLTGGLFESSFYPEVGAVQLGTLLLAALMSERLGSRPSSVVIVLILSTLVLMTHPRMAFVVLLVVAIVAVRGWSTLPRSSRVAVPVLLGVGYFNWILALGPAQQVFSRLYEILFTFSLSPNVDQALAVNRASLAQFFVVALAPLLVLGAAAGCGSLRAIRHGRRNHSFWFLVTLVAVGAAAFVNPLVLGFQSLSRGAQASLFLMILPVLVSLCGARRPRRQAIMTVLLALAILTSVAAAYRSPLMLQPGWHVDAYETEFADFYVSSGDGLFLSAGIPAQVLLFPQGTTAAAAGPAGRAYTGNLHLNFGLFPSNVGPDVWFSNTKYVAVYDRYLAFCGDEALRANVVVSVPPAHRPDFCTIFESADAIDNWSILFDAGAAKLFRVSTPP